jgi:hypothetical protein
MKFFEQLTSQPFLMIGELLLAQELKIIFRPKTESHNALVGHFRQPERCGDVFWQNSKRGAH